MLSFSVALFYFCRLFAWSLFLLLRVYRFHFNDEVFREFLVIWESPVKGECTNLERYVFEYIDYHAKLNEIDLDDMNLRNHLPMPKIFHLLYD